MPIFKEKINYPQFIADLVSRQLDLIDNRGNELVHAADESNRLSGDELFNLKADLESLVIADIIVGNSITFSNKLKPGGVQVSKKYNQSRYSRKTSQKIQSDFQVVSI